MADLMWPADLGTAQIVGRILLMQGDGPDPDRDPDVRPGQGTVTVEASVKSLRYTGAEGPILWVKHKTDGVLDAEGYLCTREEDGTAGVRGLIVPATDSELLSPTDFTYKVSIAVGTYRADFSVEAPAGAVIDLATVAPVPSSGGTAIIVDTSTADRAEAAADRAEAAADEAEGYAPTFVWDGTALIIDGGEPVDLKGEQGTTAWADLTGKPDTYPPEAHTHPVEDVTGLAARLAALEQDTGIRDVREEFPDFDFTNPGGHAHLSRIRSEVFLSMNGLPLETSVIGVSMQFSLPPGFRGGSYSLRGIARTGTLTGAVSSVSSSYSLNPQIARTAGVGFQMLLHFRTSENWPTTLPGTPAP